MTEKQSEGRGTAEQERRTGTKRAGEATARNREREREKKREESMAGRPIDADATGSLLAIVCLWHGIAENVTDN